MEETRKLSFSLDEVISYVEDKINYDNASQDEVDFYTDYKWGMGSRVITLHFYIFKELVNEMRSLYGGEK